MKSVQKTSNIIIYVAQKQFETHLHLNQSTKINKNNNKHPSQLPDLVIESLLVWLFMTVLSLNTRSNSELYF